MSEPFPDLPDDPSTTPRGEATREALVTAAVEIFGQRGYHAATNRALAEAAGVNAALIGYHFGGKRGLYLAAFEHIADGMARRLGPVARTIDQDLEVLEMEEPESPAELRARLLPLLHRLLDGFVAMLTAEESASWARLLVREQQDPTEALDIVYEGMLGRVLSLATRLIARMAGTALPRARLLALTLLGQAVVFRVARTTTLRHLGWNHIGPEEVEILQRTVRDNATAVLTTLTRTADSAGGASPEGDRS